MPTDPLSPNDRLAEAARQVAARRLGRLKAPVAVTVAFDEQLGLERIAVELVAAAPVEGGRFNDCLRDVIIALTRGNHRMTTTRLSDALEQQGTSYGDTVLKTTLAQAVRDEVITNKPDAKPPGYGLPGWP